MRKIFEYLDNFLWNDFRLFRIWLVMASLIIIAYSLRNKHKYTIYSQDRTYHVDTFRVYGGQLNFDDGDKNIIVKGNYIIEINR
jgi:hypothetical protein